SVQSDCPHRERFGYGGDIVATSEALIMNFGMNRFYAKAVNDWADAARPDGMLTDTAPFVGIQYCGVGWAMAHPLLMRELERYYGNRRLLEEQYDVAKRWLKLVAAQNTNGIISNGLSDHEALTPSPAPPLVTPLYFQSARMLGEMASWLGRTNDVAEFAALAGKIRSAYQSQFIETAIGRVGPGTQASQSFALYSDLVPAELAPKALDGLLKNIRDERRGHLSTGIMGTKFMLDVLSRNGQAETAYGIVTQTNFPGWGWMLANGATTLWEHWALSTNTHTHDHPMFGSVSQWMMQWLGGIQLAPDAIGFDRIVIRPQTVADLSWVKSSYNSVRGPIVSNWRRKNGKVHFEIVVPANTTAQIYIPAAAANQVFESGKPIGNSPSIALVRSEQCAAVFAVGSGHYQFESPDVLASRH
ncbi:MAG: alpha-L-rhamnosidase-related protein, partial [Verrucomicrobiota bacterium]